MCTIECFLHEKKNVIRFLKAYNMTRKVRLKSRTGPRVEVRSGVDSGWYDGDITLVDYISDKPSVRVNFTGFAKADDEFWDLEILRSESEIRKRVRLLSHQLQDKECDQVTVGMIVCATYVSPDGKECRYHDALVTAVSKAVHLNKDTDKEVCPCKFTIQWQEGRMKGNSTTVECRDISLIVARDVGNHSVVRALLHFARDSSVITPVISQCTQPEVSTLESQDSPQSATNSEGEEILETTQVQDQQESRMEVSCFKGLQIKEYEGLEEEKAVKEVNQGHNSREEKCEVNEVDEMFCFTGEDLKILDVQKQRSCTEKPEIEGIQGQETLEVNSEEEETEAREGLREEELEREQQELNPECNVIELDWDEELEVERLMDQSDLHYKPLEDEFLDLPRDIACHLRNFQLVQDCLAKETLELEKFLVKKS